MTNEQYAEIINRAAKNLLDSTKEYKKTYNSDTHGTKSEYIRVKQTGEIYETGLSNLASNITNDDGKIKSKFEETKKKSEKVTYDVPNPKYDPEHPDKEPETIEESKTMEQEVKELNTDAIAEASNTGMALTIAFSIAQEIGILRDEYDKKIQEYDKKIRDLQNEIQNIKAGLL